MNPGFIDKGHDRPRPEWALVPITPDNRTGYDPPYRGHIAWYTTYGSYVTSTWYCPHEHPTRAEAVACADAELKVNGNHA